MRKLKIKKEKKFVVKNKNMIDINEYLKLIKQIKKDKKGEVNEYKKSS